jgi:nucleoid DNA-binding protein
MARKPKEAPETAKTEDGTLKKPELLDAVVARTNLKKRDVKPAVEAALAVLGEALRGGAVVNLPPLGKLRVVKTKPLDGGAAVVTLKLRTPKDATVAAKAVSDDA